jgi:hypothetical protein
VILAHDRVPDKWAGVCGAIVLDLDVLAEVLAHPAARFVFLDHHLLNRLVAVAACVSGSVALAGQLALCPAFTALQDDFGVFAVPASSSRKGVCLVILIRPIGLICLIRFLDAPENFFWLFLLEYLLEQRREFFFRSVLDRIGDPVERFGDIPHGLDQFDLKIFVIHHSASVLLLQV